MDSETEDVYDEQKKLLEMVFDSEDACVQEFLMGLFVRLTWLEMMQESITYLDVENTLRVLESED